MHHHRCYLHIEQGVAGPPTAPAHTMIIVSGGGEGDGGGVTIGAALRRLAAAYATRFALPDL